MKDWSVSTVAAGFLAVLIAYAGPAVIFVQVAQSAQASDAMLASWIWGISIGSAVTSILLSWWLKAPIVTAWSAPGSAMLITLFPELSINEAVGAYITAAVIIFIIGVTGYFDRLIRYVPRGIAAGLLAGILFQFGTDAFRAVSDSPILAFGMIATYIICRQWLPRYSIVMVLLVGIVLAALLGGTRLNTLQWQFTVPLLITPEWSLRSTLSLALPLVLVTLSGLFLPGMAILRVSGYDTLARPILLSTSIASVFVAFVGGITITLAAITASLCTSPEAHPDPRKRYTAGISNGIFYLLGGLSAGTIVMLFTALPPAFVAVLAGLALVGAIMSNIVGAMQDETHREAAIITFIATASGMSFLGLGSAFWGTLIGGAAYLVFNQPRSKRV